MIFCFCFMFSHLLLLHYFLLITVIHTLFSVTHPAVFCMMYFFTTVQLSYFTRKELNTCISVYKCYYFKLVILMQHKVWDFCNSFLNLTCIWQQIFAVYKTQFVMFKTVVVANRSCYGLSDLLGLCLPQKWWMNHLLR
jgi:hypothetical protein